MLLPVKITKDLEIIADPAVALSGAEALELGKRLIEKGAFAIAREAVGWPKPRRARREAVNAG